MEALPLEKRGLRQPTYPKSRNQSVKEYSLSLTH